jgi:outer membrane protein W
MKKLILILAFLSNYLSADIFEEGKLSFGVSAGVGTSYGNTYSLVGLDANYFLIDNLAVGVSYRGWFGAEPTQNELALGANYFILVDDKLRPYVGAFVRETFISDNSDFTSFGARGGMAITMSSNSYVGVGYAYEQYDSCVRDSECSTSYPEVVFVLSF